MQIEPQDKAAPEYATIEITDEERMLLRAAIAAHHAANRTCPTCGAGNPLEQLVCLHCQSDLVAREITANLEQDQSLPGDKIRAIGHVLLTPSSPIYFTVGSTT